jgi:phospholipase/carboxylesterase
MGRVLATGADPASARLTAIMVHGRGRTPEEMAGLAARFDVGGVRYLCPEAPGQSWYPNRFVDPLEANQPQLDGAYRTIEAIIDGLIASGVPTQRIVLAGFSQGACLVAQILTRRPALYAAALIFTGGLIGPPGTVWPLRCKLRQTQVLLTGSEIDEWVPAWRSRETATVLADAGARVETVIYPDRPHEICDDEIVRARSMLLEALGQAAPPPYGATRS